MFRQGLNKYWRTWRQLSNCAISSYLSNRVDSSSFFIGKLVRFVFFLVLILSIFNHTDLMAGYGKYEVILFFLTFNLIDVIPQALFRGIYLFREDVRKGNFDFILSKPINPLFYSLTRLTDVLDTIFLLPVIALLVYVVFQIPGGVEFSNLFAYILFLLLGLIIVVAIHIISACITIWTLESGNFIWFYRESMTIGRFPPEILSSTVQLLFTFIMPIILIVGFPAKILLGALSFKWALFGAIYTFLFLAFSLWFWQVSLKKYSSASS